MENLDGPHKSMLIYDWYPNPSGTTICEYIESYHSNTFCNTLPTSDVGKAKDTQLS